jgi:hypothetical protein
LVGTGATVVTMSVRRENLVRKLETQAVEWMLKEHPEIPSFSLNLVSLHRPGFDNWRNSTDCTFLITAEGKGNMLLVWAAGHGAWSVNGVDYSKGQFKLFDKDAWMNVLKAYAQVSSPGILSGNDSIPFYSRFMSAEEAEITWQSQLKANPKLGGSSFDHKISSAFTKETKVLMNVASMNQLSYATANYYLFKDVSNSTLQGEYTLNLTPLADNWYGYKDLGDVMVVQSNGHFNLFLKESGRMVKLRNPKFLEINGVMCGFNVK